MTEGTQDGPIVWPAFAAGLNQGQQALTEMTADRDRWKRRAQAMHRQAQLLRDCWRFAGDETPSSGQKRCHADEAEVRTLRARLAEAEKAPSDDVTAALRVASDGWKAAELRAEGLAGRVERMRPLVQAYRDIALLQGGTLDHVIPLCDAALTGDAILAADAELTTLRSRLAAADAELMRTREALSKTSVHCNHSWGEAPNGEEGCRWCGLALYPVASAEEAEDMTDQERIWQKVVAKAQADVSWADSHHWPHVVSDDAILAADARLRRMEAALRAIADSAIVPAEAVRIASEMVEIANAALDEASREADDA